MRPTVVDAPWSACLSIGHTRQLNGRTYRDAVWGWMGMGSRLEMPQRKVHFSRKGIFKPTVKYRKYLACGRYSQRYSVGAAQRPFLVNTWGDSDVISFNIYASWFSPPFCG